MGCQICAMVVTWPGWLRWRRWRRWCGWHKGALTWKSPGADDGGDDWWRRAVASMVGVDGGLGSSTQGALMWKSLCVPSSDGDTHRGSFASRLNSLQNISGFFVPVSRSRFVTVCCVSC